MKEYTIGFLEWWYLFKMKELLSFVSFKFYFFLNVTGAYPMITNFFKPLFGFDGFFERIVSMIIRFWWGLFGFIAAIFLIIPYIGLFLIAFLLPVLPIVPFINLLLK